MRVIKQKMMIWVEHAACMGVLRKAYKSVVGKPEEKSLERTKHRLDDNNKMHVFHEIYSVMLKQPF